MLFEEPLNLAGLQDWDRAQCLADLDSMGPDELRLELRFAILQQECYDLLEVGQEFVYARALGMGARPAGDVADV